ncbi:MAG: type II toxin-antitoxin system HipA family toxin [Bacteroidota bacterium]
MSRLKVSLKFGEQPIAVGELVQQDRGPIYFRFYEDFLDSKLNISPFKLPHTPGLLQTNTQVFDGLFGLFADSLPDGWGKLLLDRALLSRGQNLADIDPITRLAYVGDSGMGALIYEPIADLKLNKNLRVELDELAAEAAAVLEEQGDADIDELLRLGGSSAGARPKIVVNYNSESKELSPGHLPPKTGYEPWLIKFNNSQDGPDTALIEYAYAQIARQAGLEIAETRLFKGKSGRLYFGTKRFDRVGSKRLHLHSVAGMLHDNFRLSNLDYGHLMDAALKLENSLEAATSILRLAAFNVFACNRDDHSKNVSFLMNEKGIWRLAPAYDLTFSPSPHGHHSITVAGVGKNPGHKELLSLASTFGIDNAKEIIQEVEGAVNELPIKLKELGVRQNSIKLITAQLGV